MREQIDSFDVVGLPLRTSNREADRTIPGHWKAAAEAGLVGSSGTETYAVYTDYTTPGDDLNGAYTRVIGCRARAGEPVPAGLAWVTVPASVREVVVPQHRDPERIGETWAAIWARSDLDRDYRSDYERYGADGSVSVSVGVHRTS